MVKIRLTRVGRRNRPHYRIGVFDSRTRRDGTCVERLGTYDPMEKDDQKKVVIDDERAKYWIGKGAQPSETVSQILKDRGIAVGG